MSNVRIVVPGSTFSIVIFHAYTCSPLEFKLIAAELSERFNANVLVPTLPGHTTHREELLQFLYKDYREFALHFVAENVPSHHRLITIGHCFGGYLAAEVAAKRNPICTILLMVPFYLRWYLRLPFLSTIMQWKQWWKKPIPPSDNERRRHLRFYDSVPGSALKLMEDANEHFRKIVAQIPSGIMSIHISGDKLEDHRSPEILGTYAMKKSEYETHTLQGAHHELLLGDNAAKVRRLLFGYIGKEVEDYEELRKKRAPIGEDERSD